MLTSQEVREAVTSLDCNLIKGSFIDGDGCCPMTAVYCHRNNISLAEVKSNLVVRYWRDRDLNTISFYRGFDGNGGIVSDDFLLGQQLRKELDDLISPREGSV
jgi:hypothetical protein